MSPLRGRAFRTLWTAGLISDTGDWLLLVALPILVYQLTGSTLGTALAFLVELAPPILLGPVAGRLADRWDRRRALIALCVVQAAALIPLLAVHGRHDLWIVYIVIATESVLATLFDPCKNALLPTLVAPAGLVPANAMLEVNTNLARLLGGSLGGALLGLAGLRAVTAVDAASFVLAAALISRVPRRVHRSDPEPTRTPAGDRPPDASRRTLRAVFAAAALCAVGQGIFVVLFVPFVARTLHGDATETGLLRGVQAVGAVAAGLLLSACSASIVDRAAPRRSRAVLLAAVGATVFGLLDLAIWNTPLWTRAEPLYIVLFIIAGAPGTLLVTGLISALQQASPATARGRTFGLFGAVYAAGQALGELAAGLLGDRIGVVTVLNAQAILYLAGAVVVAAGLTPRRNRARPPIRPVLAHGGAPPAADSVPRTHPRPQSRPRLKTEKNLTLSSNPRVQPRTEGHLTDTGPCPLS